MKISLTYYTEIVIGYLAGNSPIQFQYEHTCFCVDVLERSMIIYRVGNTNVYWKATVLHPTWDLLVDKLMLELSLHVRDLLGEHVRKSAELVQSIDVYPRHGANARGVAVEIATMLLSSNAPDNAWTRAQELEHCLESQE